MRTLATLLVLLAAQPAWAAPPSIEIPAEIKADVGTWVVVTPKTDAVSVRYVALDGLAAFPSSELKDPRKLIVNPPAAKRYRFVAVAASDKGEQAEAAFTLVVGGAPAPPTPVDPVDPVVPKPPDKVTSFKVIFVYDTGKPVPIEMQHVLFGTGVLDYLEAKTTPAAGVGRGFRRYSPTTDATNERDETVKAHWQAVQAKWAAEPATRPARCVVVGVNDKAIIEPWPETEAAALALFKKHRGE